MAEQGRPRGRDGRRRRDPPAMAYATVAGLPVEIGLYTCMVPMLVYALLGGARRMSISTTSTIVALTAVALAATGVQGTDNLVATATTLTLMVGVMLLAARLLRLGFLVEGVSEVVLIGLKIGVGLTIAASQLPKLLGIPPPSTSGFFQDIGNVFRNLGDVSVTTLALSAGTVVGLVVLKKVAPRVPGPLIALVVGIGLVVFADIDQHGVAVIAEVPRGLPVPHLPPLHHLGDLAPYALAIALLAYLESISVARATRETTDPALDNDRELVAVGAASVAGAFFQTVPAAGGFSQTLVNADAGARTQMSELVTVALALVVALVLAPLLSDLPQATLGAIVLVAVTGLISFRDLARLARLDRVEFVVAVITGAIALLANLLVGVAAGVVLTFYLLLRLLDHPVVVELRGRPRAATWRPRGRVTKRSRLARPADRGDLLHRQHPRRAAADPGPGLAQSRPPEVVLVDVGGTVATSVPSWTCSWRRMDSSARTG